MTSQDIEETCQLLHETMIRWEQLVELKKQELWTPGTPVINIEELAELEKYGWLAPVIRDYNFLLETFGFRSAPKIKVD